MGDETFLSQLVDSRLLQMDYLTGCLKVYKPSAGIILD